MNKDYINKLKYIFPAAILTLVVLFSAFNNTENIQKTVNIADKNHKNTAAELVNSRKTAYNFAPVNLFEMKSSQNSKVLGSAVSKAVLLNLNKQELKSIYSSKPENITLNIPASEGGYTELELVRVYFMPQNFTIKTSSGISELYNQGVYYQGIVKGDNTSLAAISIFNDDIIGIVSTNKGSYNLGAIQDDNKRNTDTYIYYNDRDLLKTSSFKCDVPDGYGEFYREPVNNVISPGKTSSTTSPVRMYYVCDYQMFLDKGSNIQNVANYVTAVFNQVNLLYNNESLNMVLASAISVYNTPDPYRTYTTEQTFEILKAFGTDLKNNFDGDLAQLLSTRTPVTGAIAWVRVLCQSYEPGSQSGRYAFSEIENTFQNVPVYSWTIEVIAHETGHNFGSMHTQACVWPTISGQIDSCVDSEGGCVIGTRPTLNGTIMSYCHIPQGGAINFTLGFGPLPGDTIRLRYSQALCLDSALNSSELPLAFTLLQNYPNPFNPTTNIKFALPQAGIVSLKLFDVTGREIASLIDGQFYAVGIFSYTFDASRFNLASGVYFYKLDVSSENKAVYSEIKKMALVK